MKTEEEDIPDWFVWLCNRVQRDTLKEVDKFVNHGAEKELDDVQEWLKAKLKEVSDGK